MNFLILLKSLILALLTFNQVEVETHYLFSNLSNNRAKQESSQRKSSEKFIDKIEEAEEDLKRRYQLDFFAIILKEDLASFYQLIQLNVLLITNNSNPITSAREILPRGPPLS